MKLNKIYEAVFPSGEKFDSALSDTPFLLADEAANITIAYHASNNPNLEQTGIMTRAKQGLPDLYKAGLDSTYQNSVYLAISPECIPVEGSYLYRIDLSDLDRHLFKADEDALGHCAGVYDYNDWIGSIMCMGSFRYDDNIPASAINRVT